jgi:hypothetical protein
VAAHPKNNSKLQKIAGIIKLDRMVSVIVYNPYSRSPGLQPGERRIAWSLY